MDKQRNWGRRSMNTGGIWWLMCLVVGKEKAEATKT